MECSGGRCCSTLRTRILRRPQPRLSSPPCSEKANTPRGFIKGWIVALRGFPTQRIAWRLKQLGGRQITLCLDAKHQDQGEHQRTTHQRQPKVSEVRVIPPSPNVARQPSCRFVPIGCEVLHTTGAGLSGDNAKKTPAEEILAPLSRRRIPRRQFSFRDAGQTTSMGPSGTALSIATMAWRVLPNPMSSPW
jgi:hypothetical protein